MRDKLNQGNHCTGAEGRRAGGREREGLGKWEEERGEGKGEEKGKGKGRRYPSLCRCA